VNKGRHENGS